MGRLLQPLLVYLSVATDRELARQVQFLKEENRILRARLPERITVTPRERQRLIKYGKNLGPAIKELITIVTPRTFARWLSGELQSKKTSGKQAEKRPGRPLATIPLARGSVECQEELGGLLKHYSRKAA